MIKKVGLIVNPLAGIGGRVGLKGSDGLETYKKAVKLGATPEAPGRAAQALKIIAKIKDNIQLLTYPSDMGETSAVKAGFSPVLIGSIGTGLTTQNDTMDAARLMVKESVDLIIFAGGDGTARDIYTAIGDKSIPVIGIPAGVKIHSAVYAVNPRSAGEAALEYLQGTEYTLREAEVMDIDEDLFRKERVSAKLYGYLSVPQVKLYMQSVKVGSHSVEAELDGIASDIIQGMEKDTYYIIGPGTTTRSIMDQLKLKNTLIGIDVVLNKKVVLNDAGEYQIIDLIKKNKVKIVVTIIGGQGHVFGRGNQQLSPKILWAVGKDNINIIATQDKLLSLKSAPLIIDTGDPKLDIHLSGYKKIITNYGGRAMYRVSN